ncbi:MAG: hypothetical protein ACRCZF_05915, partial [Gemmataceae bacterium]
DRFPIVASFDGTLDFHDWHGHGTPLDDRFSTREACRQQTPTLLLAPDRAPERILFACDPESYWWRSNDRLAEKLRAYAVAHTAFLEGPPWTDFVAKVLAIPVPRSRRLM